MFSLSSRSSSPPPKSLNPPPQPPHLPTGDDLYCLWCSNSKLLCEKINIFHFHKHFDAKVKRNILYSIFEIFSDGGGNLSTRPSANPGHHLQNNFVLIYIIVLPSFK